MMRNKTYKVADHIFSIEMSEDSFLWERMKVSYGPFETSENESGIFSLTICDEVKIQEPVLVYSNRNVLEEGFVMIEVYNTCHGHYFELTQPGSKEVNARLLISKSLKDANLNLIGPPVVKWLIFNTAVDFCFFLSTADKNTVLTHASSVIYDGKAYLFLGKSGTGKSTHSRMWQTSLEGVVLMNDDHPVLRVGEDGKVVAYGSPWSGKTHCYKNISAPLGGIVRISRAPYNKANRLLPIQAYASLMTSCSAMTWYKEMADGRDRTLQSIVSVTPCWLMECLPNEDAAHVCMRAVTNA